MTLFDELKANGWTKTLTAPTTADIQDAIKDLGKKQYYWRNDKRAGSQWLCSTDPAQLNTQIELCQKDPDTANKTLTFYDTPIEAVAKVWELNK